MTEEKEELLNIFTQNFCFLNKEPIVLYGLGYRTEILINNLTEYNIVGLMDSYSSGYKAYGINVITKEEAIKLTKNIIIVSIYESAKTIYKNISHLEDYGINIYHVSGTKMKCPILIEKYDNNLLIQKEKIEKYINDHDIISFDIFDTLITRKTYQVYDIFIYIEQYLKNKLNIQVNFTELRILSEKKAYNKYGDKTTIDDIYSILKDKLLLNLELIEKIKTIEIETEKKFIIKRYEVVELLEYCVHKNKEIIFVSDMYFNSNIIKNILEEVGIIFNNKIYISCDIGKSKHNGSLWKYISDKHKDKKILHIGDNENSDVIQANKYNIKGIKIDSPSESYNNSIIKENFDKYNFDLDERLILGNFISYIFNSPFKNYNTTIRITSHFDIGYLFFGPLIFNFLQWMINECLYFNISKILFISRDGYILEKLYNKYYRNNKIKGLYFYTSRQSLSVISIFNENDIIDNIDINYKTSINMKAYFNDFLKNRFGVDAKINDKYKDKKLLDIDKDLLIEHIISNYKKEILENSLKERNEYFEYINSLSINNNDKLAFINFIGSGATQYYLEKLLHEESVFFYFATTNRISAVNLKNNFKSLYGDKVNQALSNNPLVLNTLISEAVFTSPEGQFIKFNNGNIIFDYDEDNRYSSGIDEVHRGIDLFFYNNKDLYYTNDSSNFTLEIYSLLFDESKIYINDNIKSTFFIMDSFLHGKRTWK
ncbi:HAD-IA family hydrolase [Brachyspira alvinipulli]|uniref:HAD-IA family hydrolase n=1 Tax=Brachyspira alvinipulli TaxID=84379 RepID=UPI0030052027